MKRAGLERDLARLSRTVLGEVPAHVRWTEPGIAPEDDLDLLVSRTITYALHDAAAVDNWLERQRADASLQAEIVPIDALPDWGFDPISGALRHISGRFFSITGLAVRHRADGRELQWDQPIIEQPEIGILGIVAKKINGVLHVCLHAKEEPGNIGSVQLSPTVQATFSNYMRVHHGASPPFLDHFTKVRTDRVLLSRLQAEDGGRFLYKTNRNMIVRLDDEFPDAIPDDFIWLTLRQVGELIGRDNLVNACTRSVLSAVVPRWPGDSPLARALREIGLSRRVPRGLFDEQALTRQCPDQVPNGAGDALRGTMQWFDDRKAMHHIVSRRIRLAELAEWHLDGKGFLSHRGGKFFRIIGLRVRAASREVASWSQPIIENPSPGIIGLLVRDTAAGPDVLLQAKAEPGNRPVVQLAPTVQFTPGNYHGSRNMKKPFLFEEFCAPEAGTVVSESLQAEEGARFFRECHRHQILRFPKRKHLDLPDNFRWVPLRHVRFLLHLGEQVNSCARSILACLP